MAMQPLSLAAASLALGLVLVTTPLSAQPAPANDPVVARVNGMELHRSEVDAVRRQLAGQGQKMSPEMLIDQMVSGMLITEAGRKANLADDPEVKQKTAQYEDRVIQQVYINRAVEAATTDARLHEQYEKFLKEQPPSEEVSARHILVATEDEAKAIIADLGKGADFATIAKEKSTDPAKDNGGDLGFFTRESMVPEFADAAFKLGKGEYTKTPVHTQFGWHVILLEDRRAAAPPTFEDSKAELSKEVAHDVIIAKVKELKDAAKIETFALDGSPAPAKP